MSTEEINSDRMHELLSWSSHVIFVSINAVHFFDLLTGAASDSLKDKIILAAGKGTAGALEDIGIPSAIRPDGRYGSEGLLALKELHEANVKGKHFLIIRGNDGRELLREELESRGAVVQYACVYRRGLPDVSPEYVQSIWEGPVPDIIVLTSNQGLANLIEITGEKYRGTLFTRKLVVMSHRIADTAIKSGFVTVPVVASDQSDDGLISAIERSLEQ
jgi:uroporphyrinogen-III synthase